MNKLHYLLPLYEQAQKRHPGQNVHRVINSKCESWDDCIEVFDNMIILHYMVDENKSSYSIMYNTETGEFVNDSINV